MHWVAELTDGSRISVPSIAKDNSENILRFGLKALLRRMLRHRPYLDAVADGLKVSKFINLRTSEELIFSGSHAPFTDLFSALMEETCNKVFYHQRQIFLGDKITTKKEPLDFEGSVLQSVRSKVGKIQNVFHTEMTGRKSFMLVEKIPNNPTHTPFLIEHHFTFEV